MKNEQKIPMLVHIVPAVPPVANGLADYCYKLWENWPLPRPDWHCIAPSISEDSHAYWPEAGLSSTALDKPGLLHALAEAKATSVVLHYVGYGYHPKGCPTWLPQALKTWKRERDRELVVMFHELYNTLASPWQTSYWLRPYARKIVIDLASIADRWATSCPEYQARLSADAPLDAYKGTIIPVGTNIAPVTKTDSTKMWPLAFGHKLKVVIFGLPSTRLWAVSAHQNLLRSLCEKGMIEAILLLGRSGGTDKTADKTKQVCKRIGFAELWKSEFDLAPSLLSRVLVEQDLGLIANSTDTLTKSGVYAALCAHAILPVAARRQEETTTSSPPCIVNDDVRPNSCIEQLLEKRSVEKTRSQVFAVNENLLKWENIAGKFAEITNNSNRELAISEN